MAEPFRIFIGWDSREDIAYQVCRSSLLAAASLPLDIRPIKQAELRAAGLYRREGDPLASTEFTYTRFLVPELAGHRGLALFVDCDFLFQADIAGLLSEAAATPGKALWCVHHDYRPTETIKMDFRTQTVYPRKNWSSLMLFDCGHPAHARLTNAAVNTEPGSFLHQLRWLKDEEIGALDERWNWLEGWSNLARPGVEPKAIHFTRGGPWFENWQHVAYADRWLAEAARIPSPASPFQGEGEERAETKPLPAFPPPLQEGGPGRGSA